MGWRRINIGNRKSAQENAEEVTNYDANKAGDGVSPIGRTAGAPGGRGRVRRDRGTLNQYTAVGEFVPEFDADGNQTKVQTSTGIWNVTYNAENRPTVFRRENSNGSITRVTCAYDYMGRRATKKVETITTNAETGESSSAINLNHAYIYRGYLQITCYNLQPVPYPCLWHIAWDPTQPVATRPLAIQMNSTWYCYGWDLTKNVCEVFSNTGTISNTVIYSYTPYGAVTASGMVTQSPRGIGGGLDDSTAVAPQGRTADGAAVSQPIQWSSEFYDDELGLVYYNYRHYNPTDGRWQGRDSKGERESANLYRYVSNDSISCNDVKGLSQTTAKMHLRWDVNANVYGNDLIVPEKRLWKSAVDALDDEVYCWECISTLVVHVHGNPQLSTVAQGNEPLNASFDPQQANTISDANVAKMMDYLLEKEDFCDDCTIYWLSCNTGLANFVKMIASKTKCRVYAPKGTYGQI